MRKSASQTYTWFQIVVYTGCHRYLEDGVVIKVWVIGARDGDGVVVIIVQKLVRTVQWWLTVWGNTIGHRWHPTPSLTPPGCVLGTATGSTEKSGITVWTVPCQAGMEKAIKHKCVCYVLQSTMISWCCYCCSCICCHLFSYLSHYLFVNVSPAVVVVPGAYPVKVALV